MITSPRAAVAVQILSLSLSKLSRDAIHCTRFFTTIFFFSLLLTKKFHLHAKYVKNFPGGGLKTREIYTRESLRTNARIINHFLREY
jgi:hypothetical protein